MGRVFDVDQLDVSRLLEQWRWLCGQSVTLIARNSFGDMFLRTNGGKILWLNVKMCVQHVERHLASVEMKMVRGSLI